MSWHAAKQPAQNTIQIIAVLQNLSSRGRRTTWCSLHFDLELLGINFDVLLLNFNLLKPNDIYICRTAALTSRRYILNIYSTTIRTEYFKHAA